VLKNIILVRNYQTTKHQLVSIKLQKLWITHSVCLQTARNTSKTNLYKEMSTAGISLTEYQGRQLPTVQQRVGRRLSSSLCSTHGEEASHVN